MSTQAQRLDLRVAIIATEARAGAYASTLMVRLLQKRATDDVEQDLWREMDVLAALRAHARALGEDEQAS